MNLQVERLHFLIKRRVVGLVVAVTSSICDVEVPNVFFFHCFCARSGDQEMILARNIDFRSILQKPLKQFGPAASKYERSKMEIKEQLSVNLTPQTSLFYFMFLQSAFQFRQYGKKKNKGKNKVGTFTAIFAAGYPSSS